MTNGNVLTPTEASKEVTRLRDLKVSTRDLIMIKPSDLDIEPGHNPRNYHLPENRAHLDAMKKSIKEEGVRVPLLVRFDSQTKKGIVVDGECRLRSVWELILEGEPIEAVPTIQVPGGNEADRLILTLTANTGKPLSKWESGTAFVRLQKFGLEPEVIAKRLGYSLRFVTEAIELSDAPQEVKEMLSIQAVTPALALQQLRTNAPEAVTELKQRVTEAQKAGKKTAKRSQDQPINTKALVNLISKLVASIGLGDGDLFDESYNWIEVDRATMVKVAALVGITEEKVKGKRE